MGYHVNVWTAIIIHDATKMWVGPYTTRNKVSDICFSYNLTVESIKMGIPSWLPHITDVLNEETLPELQYLTKQQYV